ncbi:MT-A70 family methyltransferase [Bosea sp. LjRoot90]|uniref:MT-A70 family methyltransferase n=1 Tax=Bosea sp. LjRoot90 TaxID=3342342 RepID=UPI003ED09F67
MSGPAGLSFHSLANLFPLIEGEAFADLVGDVRAHGLREPIVLLDGEILDGRNRYRAGLAAELFEPQPSRRALKLWFREHDDAQDGAPLAFVLSRNLHRRHLSESQRAMVAVKLEGFRHGGVRAGEQDADLQLAPLTRAEAADIAKVSPRSVAFARVVIDQGVPELAREVEQGGMAVSLAAELARLPVADQRELIRAADPQALYTVIKEDRDRRTALKKERRAEKEEQLGEKIANSNAALVAAGASGKHYGVIYADPEWDHETWSEAGKDRAAANHYPVSPIEAIMARPVQDIAAKDCVLYLWSTVPHERQAHAVIEAWGFKYVSQMTWPKTGGAPGTGYWSRVDHEILLIATRGSPPCPAPGTQVSSVIDAPVKGRHSEKPACVREMIERYFPTLPKIELNAREAHEGWDSWGAEAPEGAVA